MPLLLLFLLGVDFKYIHITEESRQHFLPYLESVAFAHELRIVSFFCLLLIQGKSQAQAQDNEQTPDDR